MKRLFNAVVLAGALSVAPFFTGLAAETAKTYQVTGPILEITDKMIVVQKGDERWEIARETNAALSSELKVGDKVTIHYRMHAVRVESKSDKQERKDNAKNKKK